MLVATPGQTTVYSTLHNNNSSGGVGGAGNSTVAATSTSKKSTTTLNSTNMTASSASKSLNNSKHTTVSSLTNKNSLNSNTHPTTTSYNFHQNPRNDNSISNKFVSQNKVTAASSREQHISSTITTATAHSLKNENSTNKTSTTNSTINNATTKQQSFIQTLKDSVQKALISTTGSSTNNHPIASKLTADSKLQNNCNNSTTSKQNVTSSSSTSHNTNKVSTTTTSTNSAAIQSSTSSVSLVRSKYFSCSLSKLHTVAPTIIHRYPEERQHASSTDSLQKEMCHFKPIHIVPTTPWKSGSKSRGNSLRFPKANLAIKKTEFVLKSNCDVNNRRKKLQQNRTQNDKINVDDDNNEQENKEFYGISKPKPSLSCLSTSFTKPNHQSAFVCLVAQMKSLVNLQSKKLTPVKTSEVGGTANEPIKELFVRKKPARKSLQQKEIVVPKELPKSRTTRLISNAGKNKRVSNTTTTKTTTTTSINNLKENVKRTNAKSNSSISKLSTVAITKAKSRRNLSGTKSKTLNLVALASTGAKGKLQNSVSMPAVTKTAAPAVVNSNSKRPRKRKILNANDADLQQDLEDAATYAKTTTSAKSLAPRARKSARLSKDMSNTINKLNKSPTTNQNNSQISQKPRKNPTSSVVCFSPPLTRSRLKHLAKQGKIITTETASAAVGKRRKN